MAVVVVELVVEVVELGKGVELDEVWFDKRLVVELIISLFMISKMGTKKIKVMFRILGQT